MAEEVMLLGTWASPFSRRIELALRLKGVEFGYIEEDLFNKSPLLLQTNPVHKKIPVLIHNGKPIAESIVILEYIDEAWPNNPLLPKDPYDRAVARFWAKFVDDTILQTAYKSSKLTGKELEDTLEEVCHQLELLEKELRDKEFYGGEAIGFLDIIAFYVLYWFQIRQEVTGRVFFKEERFPILYKWIGRICEVLSQDETPFLYSVVFGEGVVNDATSIVLFNAVQSINGDNLDASISLKLLGTFLYLFFTSTALGVGTGLLSAFIIKTLYFGRHSTDREVALMMLMAYLSYMLAELMNLSGILTIFFCGIVMSHYTWHNVTESSRTTTKHAFATISFIAETFIFVYVGMDALDVDKWKEADSSVGTTLAISSILFALVLVGRAAFLYPIANFCSCVQKRESNKIKFKQQFIMWWAGLIRGAVTIALAYSQFSGSVDEDVSAACALMITCTIIVVLFSTIVFGSVTKPLIEAVLLRNRKPMVSDATDMPSLEDLRILFLENGDDDGPSDQTTNPRPVRRRSSLRLLMTNPTITVHYFWRKFDDRFMRPVFGGRGFVPFVPGSPTGEADETPQNS